MVELNRRGPLAAATTELTDWILEAMDQGATALYLRAGKAPFARIDGQVEILAVEPIPLSMFERAGAMMSAGEDGWEPAGEWAWSKHIPGHGKRSLPGLFRRPGWRLYRPAAGVRGWARRTGAPAYPECM